MTADFSKGQRPMVSICVGSRSRIGASVWVACAMLVIACGGTTIDEHAPDASAGGSASTGIGGAMGGGGSGVGGSTSTGGGAGTRDDSGGVAGVGGNAGRGGAGNGGSAGSAGTVVSTGMGGAGTGGSTGTGGARNLDAGTGCPSLAPAPGTSCAPEGLRCSYGDICCGAGRTCTAGKWQVTPVGCACIIPPDAGTCGGQSCLSNQVCVHPATNRGGAIPPCVASADAGVCPAGTEFTSACFNANGSPGGCVPPVVPRPSFCATIPANCSDPLQCTCFPRDVCGNAVEICQAVSGRDLMCLNIAP